MSRVIEPARAATRTWLSRAGVAALAVIAAQLLWRTVLLGRGYFSQDDFLVMAGTQHGDAAAVLAGDYVGGFAPGSTALAWLAVHLAPLNWGVAASLVLVLQAAATALLWVVLTQVLGDRWLRLPVLVLFAFSPLTLWTTQWWVLGLAFWSATLLLMVALWAVLLMLRTGRRRTGIVVVAAVAVALLFDDRAVLYPVVVAGVALIVGTEPTVRGRAATLGRDLAGVWVGLLAVLVGYAVLRWQTAPGALIVGSELGDVITGYLRHGLAELFGGPWLVNLPAHAYLVPASWVVALNGVLLLGLVGATSQHGGATARASWGLLVVFVLGSSGVLALAGRGELIGSLGLVHRYAAALAPVVVLCIAGALREVRFPRIALPVLGKTLSGGQIEVAVTGALVVLLTASAGLSTARLASNLYHRDDRDYVTNLRAALRAEPQVVLLDGGVPPGVISSWYGERARVSAVIGYAPESPVFDLPSHALRMVREDGTLAPVLLDGPVVTEPSPDAACGYPVRTDGTEVPMQALVPDGRWVLRIGYYTSAEGFATVGVAGRTHRFAVRTGLNAVDVVVEGSFRQFRMTLEQPGATLCLTDAAAGVPTPAPGPG